MKRANSKAKGQVVGRSKDAVVQLPIPDCYAEGIEAAHTGKYAAHCPYEFSSEQGEQWLKGYYDGGGQD